MQPNGAAPRSFLVGMMLLALNKLNNFILLDGLPMRINLLKSFIADNKNLSERKPDLYRSEKRKLRFIMYRHRLVFETRFSI